MKNTAKFFAVAMLIAAMLTATKARATIYYVNIPGFSANTNLAQTVQQASSNPGIDTIYVGFGTYKLNVELIVDDILLGGCLPDGSGGITRKYPGSVNNQRAEQSILDGNSLVLSMPSQKHRVATVNAGGIIEGCVIRNGHARGTGNNPNDMSGFGGGVLLNGGKVHNCIIRGNVAMNIAYSGLNPSRGGGVFITDNGGDVVNCIIAFNMDDNGLGVDGNAGAVVNNTISRNSNCPKYVKISGNATDGNPTYRHYEPTEVSSASMSGPYIRLNDFYIASTETTIGQYACFLSAVDLSSTYRLGSAEWTGLCAANTPMYGYTNISIAKYLGMTDAEQSSGQVLLSTGTTGEYMGLGGTIGSGSEVFYANKETSKYSAGISGSTSYPADPLVRENFPMAFVSWYGSVAFSVWLGGMLPTEAQWEYAARRQTSGIQNTAAYAGNTTVLNDVAWNIENSSSVAHEVATLTATELGLYDMNGSVWEWMCDWYNYYLYPTGNSVISSGTAVADAYTVSSNAGTSGSEVGSPLYNPIYNFISSFRIMRGGSWRNASTYFPLGYRDGHNVPTQLYPNIGFRSAACVACP